MLKSSVWWIWLKYHLQTPLDIAIIKNPSKIYIKSMFLIAYNKKVEKKKRKNIFFPLIFEELVACTYILLCTHTPLISNMSIFQKHKPRAYHLFVCKRLYLSIRFMKRNAKRYEFAGSAQCSMYQIRNIKCSVISFKIFL